MAPITPLFSTTFSPSSVSIFFPPYLLPAFLIFSPSVFLSSFLPLSSYSMTSLFFCNQFSRQAPQVGFFCVDMIFV